MWKQLIKLRETVAARCTAQQTVQPKTKISLAGQKWFGSGECLRIVEIETEGAIHKIAIWNGKASSQIVELACSVQQERPVALSQVVGGGIA